MYLCWLLLFPFTYSLLDASVDDLPAYNASKEMDAFSDQLWSLANETAILIQLYNESIAVGGDDHSRLTKRISLRMRNASNVNDGVKRLKDHLKRVYRHWLTMVGASAVSYFLFSLFIFTVAIHFINDGQGPIPAGAMGEMNPYFISGAFYASLGVFISILGHYSPDYKWFFSILYAILTFIFWPEDDALTRIIVFVIASLAAIIAPDWSLSAEQIHYMPFSLFFISIIFMMGESSAPGILETITVALFTNFDTKKMLERGQRGDDNYVKDAFNLYNDFFFIQLRILQTLLIPESDK